MERILIQFDRISNYYIDEGKKVGYNFDFCIFVNDGGNFGIKVKE